MQTAKDYYSSCMVPFQRFTTVGRCDPIRVLPELSGRPWDDIALGIVHAVHPTSIRVTRDHATKLDDRSGRVTVYVNGANIIQHIEQEVIIGIPGKTEAEIDQNHELIHGILSRATAVAPNSQIRGNTPPMIERPSPLRRPALNGRPRPVAIFFSIISLVAAAKLAFRSHMRVMLRLG